MSKLLYGFFYLLSLLPLFILYGIADIFFVILYYIVGYRKEVVLTNLRIACAGKSEAELKSIRRKFFRNFMHTWIETIKFITASERQLRKMISGDFNLLYELHEKKVPRVTVLTGHFMNWEFQNFAQPAYQPYQFLAVYMHISNKPLNDLFLKLRRRFGTAMLRAGEMRSEMLPYRDKEYMLGLAADQTPGNPENAVWLNFFGRPTPFVTGPEKNARAGNTPVLMSWTEKKGLGRYRVHFEMITEDPATLPPHEIIRIYVKKLEEKLATQPENYLWTHKRWKHQWKDKYKDLWVGEEAVPTEV